VAVLSSGFGRACPLGRLRPLVSVWWERRGRILSRFGVLAPVLRLGLLAGGGGLCYTPRVVVISTTLASSSVVRKVMWEPSTLWGVSAMLGVLPWGFPPKLIMAWWW
jgi:hypothetical protein